MDAKDYEAKQHLFIYEINKIDADIKMLLENRHIPGYDANEAFKTVNENGIEELQTKRNALTQNFTAFEDSIYDFLVS
jgi:hypothetical protein